MPGETKKRFCRLALIRLVVPCLLLGCAALRPPAVPPLPSVWPTEQWSTSTPEEQGIDSRVLVEALDLIREKGINIHSLLIVRNGVLVLDACFYPYDGRTPHDVASVTKSITSTLVGLAIRKGFLRDVQQPALDFFPEVEVRDREAKSRITVENLLSMTSGLDCGYRPHEAELFEMFRNPDWARFVWDLPLRTSPGSEFAYCSGGMHLLSAIIARSTGAATLEFARRNLFDPLGIREAQWPADPQGVNHGWGDLQMHPRDMAKIGLLFLHRGRWGDRQILEAEWVERATSRFVGVRGGAEGYGYGWWLPGSEFPGLFEARGRGGQFIVVWPRLNLVAVLTGGGYNRDEPARLLVSAFRSDRPLPENPGAYAELQERIQQATRGPDPVAVPPLPETARRVSGVTYLLEPNRPGVTSIGLVFERPLRAGAAAPGLVPDQPGRAGVASGGLPFPDSGAALFTFSREGKTYSLPMGLDGVYRFSNDTRTGLSTGVRGSWASDREFVVDYNEVAGINHFEIQLNFGAGQAGGEDLVEIGLKDTTGYFDETVRGRAGP